MVNFSLMQNIELKTKFKINLAYSIITHLLLVPWISSAGNKNKCSVVIIWIEVVVVSTECWVHSLIKGESHHSWLTLHMTAVLFLQDLVLLSGESSGNLLVWGTRQVSLKCKYVLMCMVLNTDSKYGFWDHAMEQNYSKIVYWTSFLCVHIGTYLFFCSITSLQWRNFTWKVSSMAIDYAIFFPNTNVIVN